MSVTVGLKGRAETVVSDANTAQAACSGALPVFGTPFMCALMEEAAWKSIAPHLEEGQSTVGTRLDISHDSATPVGMKVWAESEVTEADGKRLVLKVAAYDERGLIGQGTHERFIITSERFLAKTARKLEA
ncbi:MAG: thioesterase family protein [Lawsonibacter sp.]|nr:thioesterase family protein [Lawsonibacter sp.]MCI9566564.1 thioesterase family protein [Lawsonibacter sp.]